LLTLNPGYRSYNSCTGCSAHLTAVRDCHIWDNIATAPPPGREGRANRATHL